jgi:hypothetical protein
MSRVDEVCDNSAMESFFLKLKTEKIRGKILPDKEEGETGGF